MVFSLNYNFRTLRGDLLGGLTATVVALPISLAFGVASGLGPSAGLYGAISVGLFAALFGGTKTQISGPTAPMTVAMAVIVTDVAQNISEAFSIVIMAGLLQILLGLSRIGRFISYTPRVVVSGFMSGIGIIVMLIQIPPSIGIPPAPDGVVGIFHTLPETIMGANSSALIIAVTTLATAVFWPKNIGRYLPGTLVALLVGTLLSIFWFTEVPVIGQIPTGLPDLHLEVPSTEFLLHAIEPALILALLGSVDSLLTSLVADTLTSTNHNPNRELVGQGIGNVMSGLVGGLPGAGSTTGTVTNIRAGGNTVLSGICYAMLMLLLLLGMGHLIGPVPIAALAGVLMRVGWDIIDWRIVTRIHLIRHDHVLVMLLTLCLTVFVDLLTAVAIGLIAAGMSHARKLEQFELDSVVSVPILDQVLFSGKVEADEFDPYTARVGLVSLRGVFTVASSIKLVEVIAADIKDHEVVIFDFSGTTYIDENAALVIEQLTEVATQKHTEFVVMGLSATVAKTLYALKVLKLVPQQQVVDTMSEAEQVARDLISAGTVSTRTSVTDGQ